MFKYLVNKKKRKKKFTSLELFFFLLLTCFRCRVTCTDVINCSPGAFAINKNKIIESFLKIAAFHIFFLRSMVYIHNIVNVCRIHCMTQSDMKEL